MSDRQGVSPTERCSDCGLPLLAQGSLAGLCAQCLLELATAEVGDDTLGADGRPTEVAPVSRGELRPGRILARRYRLMCPLGRGGMGEVWRAFDFKLRVEVALKTVRPEIVRQEQALEMLRGEVRAARQVVSPNVCRVFDLAAESGLEMISMEYVDGVTLGRMTAERGPLDIATASEIAAQLLAGLEAIHQAGLVHRDVKPENVMVTASGRNEGGAAAPDLSGRAPIAFASDGGLLFAKTPGGGGLYALPGGKEIRRIEGDVRWAGIRPDGLITMTPVKAAGEGQPRHLIQSWAPAGGLRGRWKSGTFPGPTFSPSIQPGSGACSRGREERRAERRR